TTRRARQRRRRSNGASRSAGQGGGGGRRAQQVRGGRASDCSRGEGRFGRVARRLLQRLVGDGLRGGDQLLQRGDAGVGSLQHLHAIADAVEQIVDVAGAVVEPKGGEEVGGVVEGRIDLLTRGQMALGRRKHIGGGLE